MEISGAFEINKTFDKLRRLGRQVPSRLDELEGGNAKGGMKELDFSGVTSVHGKPVFLPTL